jgi:heat shock protein HslJ
MNPAKQLRVQANKKTGREIEIFLLNSHMKYLVIIMIFLLSACNTTMEEKNEQQYTLSAIEDNNPADTSIVAALEGAWQLQPALPSDTATGKIPTLVFDLKSQKFQGNTGCNNISGSFYFVNDSLSFNEQILMTKMACPGYNEEGFIQSLSRTNRYVIEKGVLQLMQEQTVLSKWIRKDAVAQKKI